MRTLAMYTARVRRRRGESEAPSDASASETASDALGSEVASDVMSVCESEVESDDVCMETGCSNHEPSHDPEAPGDASHEPSHDPEAPGDANHEPSHDPEAPGDASHEPSHARGQGRRSRTGHPKPREKCHAGERDAQEVELFYSLVPNIVFSTPGGHFYTKRCQSQHHPALHLRA